MSEGKVPFPNLDTDSGGMPPVDPDMLADGGDSTRGAADLEAVFGPGTVLELDRKVGEAIDIYVNNRLVARGEVVLVEDKLGVTMTEVIKAERN